MLVLNRFGHSKLPLGFIAEPISTQMPMDIIPEIYITMVCYGVEYQLDANLSSSLIYTVAASIVFPTLLCALTLLYAFIIFPRLK